MIRRPPHPFWRVFAPVLATLCFATTIISPLLDADESREPSFHNLHDEATCPRGHDHSICTQVTANLGVTTEPARHGFATIHRYETNSLQGNSLAPRGTYFFPVGSRAPPRA